VHKYEAIEILNYLLKTNSQYHFITHCVLGEIYSDVEQLSDSIRSYQRALTYFTKFSAQEVHKFYQYLIIIYNMLGLSYINKEDNEQGLGCLAKSCQIYEAYRETPGEDVYHNRSYEPKGRSFRLLY
jgi:tetratricopeptide (TPR) repeat protein